jgi:hypothetical protein
MTDVDLRRYELRHNLAAFCEQLTAEGIEVTEDARYLIDALSEQHATHALRYTTLVDDGRPTFMPPKPLIFRMLEDLLMLTRIATQCR